MKINKEIKREILSPKKRKILQPKKSDKEIKREIISPKKKEIISPKKSEKDIKRELISPNKREIRREIILLKERDKKIKREIISPEKEDNKENREFIEIDRDIKREISPKKENGDIEREIKAEISSPENGLKIKEVEMGKIGMKKNNKKGRKSFTKEEGEETKKEEEELGKMVEREMKNNKKGRKSFTKEENEEIEEEELGKKVEREMTNKKKGRKSFTKEEEVKQEENMEVEKKGINRNKKRKRNEEEDDIKSEEINKERKRKKKRRKFNKKKGRATGENTDPIEEGDKNERDYILHNVRFYDFEPKAIQCMSYEEHTRRLALSRADGSIEIWNLMHYPFVQNYLRADSDSSVEALVWYKGRLFSAGLHGFILEHNVVTGEIISRTAVTGGPTWCLALSPDMKKLAAGTEEGYVCLFDMTDCNIMYDKTLDKQEGRILNLAWHCSSEFIVTGSINFVRLWSVKTGRVTRCSISHDGREEVIVWCVAILDDMTIVSGDSRGKVSFWNGHLGVINQVITTHRADILSLAITPDQKAIYLGGVDPKIVQIAHVRTDEMSESGKTDTWVKANDNSTHTHDIRALLITQDYKLISGGVDTLLGVNHYVVNKTQKMYPHPSRGSISVGIDASCVLIKYTDRLELWRLGNTDALNLSKWRQTESGTILPVTEDRVKLLEIRSKEGRQIDWCCVSQNANWIAYISAYSLRICQFCPPSSGNAAGVRRVRGLSKDILPCYQAVWLQDAKLATATTTGIIQIITVSEIEAVVEHEIKFSQTPTILQLIPCPSGNKIFTVDTENNVTAINIKKGDNLTKNGDNLTQNGDNLAQKGGNLAQNLTLNGDNLAQNLTLNGDNLAQVGDNSTHKGNNSALKEANSTQKGDNLTLKGDNSTLKGDNLTEDEFPMTIMPYYSSPVTSVGSNPQNKTLVVTYADMMIKELAEGALGGYSYTEFTRRHLFEPHWDIRTRHNTVKGVSWDAEDPTRIYMHDDRGLIILNKSRGLRRGNRGALQPPAPSYPKKMGLAKAQALAKGNPDLKIVPERATMKFKQKSRHWDRKGVPSRPHVERYFIVNMKEKEEREKREKEEEKEEEGIFSVLRRRGFVLCFKNINGGNFVNVELNISLMKEKLPPLMKFKKYGTG